MGEIFTSFESHKKYNGYKKAKLDCRRKRTYLSRHLARKAKNNTPKVRFDVYKCHLCKKYHLTSVKKI